MTFALSSFRATPPGCGRAISRATPRLPQVDSARVDEAARTARAISSCSRSLCGDQTSSSSRNAIQRPPAAAMPALRACAPPGTPESRITRAARRRAPRSARRLVGRAIVDDDHLHLDVALGQRPGDSPPEERPAIVRRDDHGDLRGRAARETHPRSNVCAIWPMRKRGPVVTPGRHRASRAPAGVGALTANGPQSGRNRHRALPERHREPAPAAGAAKAAAPRRYARAAANRLPARRWFAATQRVNRMPSTSPASVAGADDVKLGEHPARWPLDMLSSCSR